LYTGKGKCLAASPAAIAGLPLARAKRFRAAFVQLPANHLAAGQPASKLKEDLFSTANSIELFKEMLAPISANDAADVKQVWPSGSPCPSLRSTAAKKEPPSQAFIRKLRMLLRAVIMGESSFYAAWPGFGCLGYSTRKLIRT
jgi:hypothetical protein